MPSAPKLPPIPITVGNRPHLKLQEINWKISEGNFKRKGLEFGPWPQGNEEGGIPLKKAWINRGRFLGIEAKGITPPGAPTIQISSSYLYKSNQPDNGQIQIPGFFN